MDSIANPQKIIVVGAGPVGSLAALYAAARGDDVHIYELREDLRDPSTTPLNFTKSINLALSERGINSMRHANQNDTLNRILQETIPMHARMIHGQRPNGTLVEESQPYDAHGRFIQAVDRAGLNKHLLDALERLPNVTFHFNHKLTGADFSKRVAWFEQRDQEKIDHLQNLTQEDTIQQMHKRPPEIEVDFDLLIGADGAHSATRYHLMKFARVSYQQEYIDTLWCEFHIPPKGPTSDFAIHPNRLHIWPAGSFMFIAIPSLDRSFTCTLFAPSAHFDAISSDITSKLPEYFSRYFPGVCPDLISPDELIRQFHGNPHLPLISIKCRPYHFASSAVILGDAAHAMVPFYGQGMNAGLEDVRVLFDILDKHGVYNKNKERSRFHARQAALDEYTAQRAPDAAAINDLALRNYEEMRSGVRSPVYKIRKWMEETVSIYLPRLGWRTQYSRISFENQRYTEVEQEVQHQGRLLFGMVGFGFTALSWIGLHSVFQNDLFHRIGRLFANFRR